MSEAFPAPIVLVNRPAPKAGRFLGYLADHRYEPAAVS
jgi:hypothetical protein